MNASNKLECLSLGRLFQPNLLFTSMAIAYLSETPLVRLALVENIRLGSKGLPGTNTLV